jgi:hypothetical protein
VTGRETEDALLWVESGALSYPLGTERFEGPTAGYLIDVHLHTSQSIALAPLFDLVLVAQQDYVPILAEQHPNVHWLPLAAPKAFLDIPRRRLFPASFVGNVAAGSTREQILRAINREVAMNDWRRPYTVAEMGETYAGSLLVVNPPARGDVNMRFFEALACGALVVTPPLDNGLASLAREGEDYFILDFGSEPEVVAGVKDLLCSVDFGTRADAARTLVRERHTYHLRAADVVTLLDTTGAAAPFRTMAAKDRGRVLLQLADYAADVRLAADAARLGALGPLGSHARAAARAARRWTRTRGVPGRRP